MKKPIVMSKPLLAKLAKRGNYPFCHTCGNEIKVNDVVHRTTVNYPGGHKSVKYNCDECVKAGRMYAVGKGKEDE